MSDQVKIPLPRSLQEIVGSLLFASPDPLTAAEIKAAIRAVDAEEGENAEVMDVYKSCTGREVDEALKGLAKALDVAGCGFSLVCTGGAYRMQTSSSCGRYVRALLKLDRPNRIGRASLETLAIIAYRQPITKSEIEAIRGVDVTGNVKTLMDLQLIRIVGKSELPGHPFLYGTTPIFLEHFGLSNLQQLNELDPTLQRSNPRLKAAAYRKPKAEGEKAEGEKAEVDVEKPEVEVEGEKTEVEAENAEVEVEGEKTESEGVVEAKSVDDDDDFFIDDTPDEFDDEDDDEDEDDEEEEDGQDGDGDDGAADPDGSDRV